MTVICEAVRRQALHFFSVVPHPTSPAWRQVEGEFCIVVLHPLPFAQIVEPRSDLSEGDVDAAIAEARTHVRARGKDLLAWMTGPDVPWLGDALAARGLLNEDTPGLEAIENAMALVRPPAGSDNSDVEVTQVTTLEQYAAGSRVQMSAFGVPSEQRATAEAELAERWDEIIAPGSRQLFWNASIEGKVVACASAVVADAGLNLLGGAVDPSARGCGAYRALVEARWQEAVRRGTPALTVQAGRLSGPILAKLGFEHLAEMPVYVDELPA